MRSKGITKGATLLGVLGIFVLLVVGLAFTGNISFQAVQLPGTGAGAGAGTGTGAVITTGCPTDGDTSLTINLRNIEDETASTTFDATYYLYKEGTYAATGTDTTAGTATVDCGKEYTIKLVSADGYRGDNARIKGFTTPTGVVTSIDGARLNSDGTVTFTPTGSSFYLPLVGSQHAVLEFRAKDVLNDAFMYDSGDSSNLDYEVDGVTFTSTTDNATATAVGSGGEVDLLIEVRANDTITDFNDFGTYILSDAATTVWNEPTVRFDGATLSDATDSLTVDEARAFSGYENVYKVDQRITDDKRIVSYDIKAISGVNPGAANDLQIDFASIGAFLSIDGVTVKQGANDDTSSSTTVFAVQDVTIDIS